MRRSRRARKTRAIAPCYVPLPDISSL